MSDKTFQFPSITPTSFALEAHLAPYAAHSAESRGRRFEEKPLAARTEFQRDRDRIVHSTAFRRLEYKTQVFVNHEGDLFRTRLTHSLEVAQIARSVARNLRVNEDLVEAISLAHDLGHTPFGHSGQDALNECMRDHGGFEHNLQSLVVVDELEEHYGAFNGLNLCFETREGILKHCSHENALKLGELGERFLNRKQPSIEAQIANVADKIAYNNHDVDDGLRSGLITLDQLADVALWQMHYEAARGEYPDIEGRRLIHETIRRIINTLIVDLIDSTSENLARLNPQSVDDVRDAPALVTHGETVAAQATELKRFLYKNLYRHYKVMRMANKAGRAVSGLFKAFNDDPRLLPPAYQARGPIAEESANDPRGSESASGSPQAARLIAHYIAGMTDRYALKEYGHLFVIDDN
ncbi:MAG: dNTP triphosphohydrolase, broad substrate specificity [Candidatus Burkholderia crenata]|nr:MAG: dNTP triphosphohydrolase, broad substrate specificity [Candidatus Burkholderia crenata]